MGGSALFFVSSFPVKNACLLSYKYIYLHTYGRGCKRLLHIFPNSAGHKSLISPSPGALCLVAAGGWSSETINHRNAARWCWMDPSQPSLTASPGQAGKHSSKTFPLLPQCTAMGTRRALVHLPLASLPQMLRSFLFSICYLLCRYLQQDMFL